MEPSGRRVGLVLLVLGGLALAFMAGNASGRAQAMWMFGGPRIMFEERGVPPWAQGDDDTAPAERGEGRWMFERHSWGDKHGWGDGHGWGGKPHFGFPWPLLVIGLGAALLWRARQHGGPWRNERNEPRGDEPRDPPPSTGVTTNL